MGVVHHVNPPKSGSDAVSCQSGVAFMFIAQLKPSLFNRLNVSQRRKVSKQHLVEFANSAETCSCIFLSLFLAEGVNIYETTIKVCVPWHVEAFYVL